MSMKEKKPQFLQSVVSLELDDDLYNNTESNTDTICLSDLTAPKNRCTCFTINCLRSQKKTLRGLPESPTDKILNQLDQGYVLQNHREPTTDYNQTPQENIQYEEKVVQLVDTSSWNKITKPRPDNQKLFSHATRKRLKLQLFHTKIKSADAKSHAWRCSQLFRPLIWSIVITALVSGSWCGFAEFGARIYVFHVDLNSTKGFKTVVRPPSFATQFVTMWIVLIYPSYLLLNSLMHFESANLQDLLLDHIMILASEQPTMVKFLTRCALLSVLWQLFLGCLLRSLELVTPVDCLIIGAAFPCFNYLLSWIIVHRRFCALRVIAFILSSSGLILNIYYDQRIMWHKCLAGMSIVAFSLFTVVLKRILSRPTFGQISAFYCGFGLFNLLALWPIFVFTSIIMSYEPILWKFVPWKYFSALGASLLVFIFSMDLSNRKLKRVVRALQLSLCPFICLAIRIFWLKTSLNLGNIWIMSLLLVCTSCILNAVPNKFLKVITKALHRMRSPKSQLSLPKRGKTGGKNSTAAVQNASGPTNPRSSIVVPPGSASTSRPGSARQSGAVGSIVKTRSRLSSVLSRGSTSTGTVLVEQ
ncbi:unnamed protein product [Dicrocoelium dendriticum]|nr:unnamed protein product [Dicrocoelium dendriticum]